MFRRGAHPGARAALVLVALVFAFLRLSEPSADPDLWGHVLYGQRHLFSGVLERAEPFSWTVPGAPWINHEIGAEGIMGLVHLWGGARGLWLLMVGIGAATLALAGWDAASRVPRAQRWLIWAIIALAAREVALGFAMRPQIFSCLLWVVLLIAVRHLAAGRRWPIAGIPALCILWINTHGGVLLAVVVMMALAAASGVIAAARARPGAASALSRWLDPSGSGLASWRAWAATAALSTGALLVNPYGWKLPSWLVGSVAYTRPEISEWNPTSVGASHAIFWLLGLAWIAAVMQRRARVPGWEAIAGTILLIAAIRHERHIPLFALTMIAFLPGSVSRWTAGRRLPALSPGAGWMIAILLGATAAGGAMRIVVTAAESGPLAGRMQVRPDEYPVDAIQFVRAAGIRGNAVVHFDWAQQALWELPDSRVSFDGRLDTCYPRPLIAEHWEFFTRGVLPVHTFSPREADWMLLPRGGAAARALVSAPSWRSVYSDTLAEVFVNSERVAFAAPQVIAGAPRGGGAVAFPDAIPARAAELRRK